VRVTATAICGSDLHLLHGLVPDTRIGFTFGHEFVGVLIDQRSILPIRDATVASSSEACAGFVRCAWKPV